MKDRSRWKNQTVTTEADMNTGEQSRLGEEIGPALLTIEKNQQSVGPGTPKLPESIWTGLVAEYRNIVAGCTEAPEEFHLASFLTAAGCLVGRTAWVCNPHPIYPNLYSLLVGETGITRKTTAYRFAIDALTGGNSLLDGRAKIMQSLASLEGLAATMKTDSPPPFRVLCVLDEFKSLAAKNRQMATSNLIPGLTELFNTGSSFEINTKNRRVEIEKPFLCILAASTQAWFEESVSESDVSGGFLNRWLVFTGRTDKLIPFPKPVDPRRWEQFTVHLTEAVREAKSRYELTSDAKTVYEDFYRQFRTGRLRDVRSSEVSSRMDLHATKLALLYAVLARHSAIEKDDIENGIAIAVYCAKVMGPIADRIGKSPQVDLEARIIEALQSGPMKGREIYRKLHVSAAQFDSTAKALSSVGMIRSPALGSWELVA